MSYKSSVIINFSDRNSSHPNRTEKSKQSHTSFPPNLLYILQGKRATSVFSNNARPRAKACAQCSFNISENCNFSCNITRGVIEAQVAITHRNVLEANIDVSTCELLVFTRRRIGNR